LSGLAQLAWCECRHAGGQCVIYVVVVVRLVVEPVADGF
jgi:hypothetical protein